MSGNGAKYGEGGRRGPAHAGLSVSLVSAFLNVSLLTLGAA